MNSATMEDLPKASEKEPETDTDTSLRDVVVVENGHNKENVNDGDNNTDLILPWWKFHGEATSQGLSILYIALGPIVFSGIFLGIAILYLASDEAGCLDDKGEGVIEDCEGKVYGFRPSTFVAMITIISGVLSAILLPFVGVLVDYTPHRKLVSATAAVILWCIQVSQIGISSQTWLFFAILEGIAVFIYQVLTLTIVAYLPIISRNVGHETSSKHISLFYGVLFGGEVLFMILVVGMSLGFGLAGVGTARAGQVICVVWTALCLYRCYRVLPATPARRSLPSSSSPSTATTGRRVLSFLAEGFRRVFRTTRTIHRQFPNGLRWFLLASIFADAALQGYIACSLIWLDEHLNFTAIEIGMFYMLAVLMGIPGTYWGGYLSRAKLLSDHPARSWQWGMGLLVLSAFVFLPIIDAFDLNYLAFAWSCLVGFCLGWYYVPQALFFSRACPKSQEAELTGFYLYCSSILVWAPALLFAVVVEMGVSRTFAVLAITGFFAIAIGILCLVGTWEQIDAECTKAQQHEEDEQEVGRQGEGQESS